MKAAIVSYLACMTLVAGDGGGLRPRPSPSDYPAHATLRDVTVAAGVVPSDQVRKMFATDLNKGGYIVIEVGVFPEAGREIDLQRADFALKAGPDGAMIQPIGAQAIASILQRKNSPRDPKPSQPAIYQTATIGYESGTDPVTGQRRSGVYGGGGVAVTNGPSMPPGPPPASNGLDWDTMAEELEVKALPEGHTTRTVAGYLYFPKPATKKSVAYELTYYVDGGAIRVSLTVK